MMNIIFGTLLKLVSQLYDLIEHRSTAYQNVQYSVYVTTKRFLGDVHEYHQRICVCITHILHIMHRVDWYADCISCTFFSVDYS